MTIDKDFGGLIMRGLAATAIVRLVGFRAAQQGDALIQILKSYERELNALAILTVEPWRVRVRNR